MSKIIGITTTLNRSDRIIKQGIKYLNEIDLVNVSSDYSNAISASGGTPMLLPILEYYDHEIIERIIEGIDGLLLTGGEDIDPKFYNEKRGNFNTYALMEIDIERDTFELALIKAAVFHKLPILGICRGHQLINVAFGGSLYQDISSLTETSINHLAPLDQKERLIHSVILKEGSVLKKIFNRETIKVNSFHHQSIKKVADNFDVIGISEDNIIEAIKHKGFQWILGIQWHPEMLFKKNLNQKKIFEVFIKQLKKGQE